MIRQAHEIDVDRTRAAIRGIDPPFLLRQFEATLDDFERVADEDLKCEYTDGELIVHSPASFQHEDLVLFIGSLLREYVTQHRLGRVCGSNVVMQLSDQRAFCPDVSVLLNHRLDAVRDGRIHGPVDLAVEVISRSTRDYDRGPKLAAYCEGRVPEIWLIDPATKSFEAHVLCSDQYRRSELTSGTHQPASISGLALDVAWFWRDPLPAVRDCLLEKGV